MGHYPFEWQIDDICAADFSHFQNQFSQTILQLIPFANGPVTFLDSTIEPSSALPEINKPKYWKHYIKRVLKGCQSAVATERPVLFLPVWNSRSIVGIAAVEGVDGQFADVLSEEWLNDRSRIISREFFLHKQKAIDPVTGMFNGRHFHDTLDDLLLEGQKNLEHSAPKAAPQHVSLLFIEIHSKASNAGKALHDIAMAGYYLESLFGQDLLHHLGNGIFGFIGENINDEQAQKLGKNILSWFRREGFPQIHIGINTFSHGTDSFDTEAEKGPVADIKIEQTWLSVSSASRRGPYALCTYGSISNPEAHPLKKTDPPLAAKFRKLWAGIDTFAVLLVSRDNKNQDDVFSKRLLSLIESRADAVLAKNDEIFVFLKDADAKKALDWVRNLKKIIPDDLDTTFSVGIACFPCIDFKKSDIPQNARKALLHAEFLGPDTVVPFDSISQNVSGDIYYGEGDLIRAVKEYRKGLEMEPANTNLLNSLGETYAQMNKPRKAQPFFEAVLCIDPIHYMALFNLGVANLIIGEDDKAIAYFEKALAVYQSKPETNQINDLLLQLSKLYCRTGKYKKAVSLLEKEKIFAEPGAKIPARYAFLRYLGEAYMGAGRNKDAIIALQRAIGHNPHDAHALSMLGELYALENQGDDIALSLCQQAVNINERHWKHWYRLALIRYRMTAYESALEALKESMKLERKNSYTMCLAGQIYDKMGSQERASAMFQSVIRIEPGHKGAASALRKITKTMNK
jgi:tetratricopeptide (TPR) repeat protein